MIQLGDKVQSPMGERGVVLIVFTTPEGWQRVRIRTDDGRLLTYPTYLLQPDQPDQLEIPNDI